MNPNVGLLLSTTLKNYRKTLIDNIHKSNAVFFWLKEHGAIKEEAGGERIVVPVMYAKNSTARSYSGYEALDTTPQAGIDSAEFNWKQYAVSIGISGEEERKNSGSQKIIDILEARVKQAEMSLTEQLSTALFSDGTSNSGKDLTGLEAMISNAGTYAGINSATYTWWQAGVDTATETLGLAKMRVGYNTASIAGRDAPDLIVTTQALFQTYESLLTTTATLYTETEGTKKLGDGGFQSLAFKGEPVVWDELVPSGTVYFINTNHMKLIVHKDANFMTTDFVKPENQDVRTAQILWMGNLTCDRRKSFYKLTNKS